VAAEPVTPVTPRPLARAVLRQEWQNVAFLHWPVDPDLVRPLFPAGVEPDLIGGTTYVGLVAFRIYGTAILRLPALPYLGTFPETNVRLYSVDRAGRRGVVFRSLESTRLVTTLVARYGYAVPYTWSRMRISRHGDVLTYTSRRRWPAPRGVASRISVRIGDAIADPSPLDHFLTARWGLHASWLGRTVYTPTEHPRWSLYRAELTEVDDGLVAAAGLPAPAGPPVSVLWSPGLPASFGPPVVVSRRAGE
jgi:uncharacterized protein YqjF (DUF2071 family)